MRRAVGLFALFVTVAVPPFVACGGNSASSGFDASVGEPGGDSGSGVDGVAVDTGELPSFEGGTDGGACDPPDILVVLDRTLSMSKRPDGVAPANTPAGHQKSKWYLATTAVKKVSTPPADQASRFGLEVFPLDPEVVVDAGGTGQCVTLSEKLSGTQATNTSCQPGQMIVSPDLGTGNAIATTLDPETFKLCISTPLASALDTAAAALKAIALSGRKQIVLLVTDGGETCRGTESIGVAQALAAAGVQTYVVGFGSPDAGAAGVNVKLLNNLACAGKTATDFATECALAEGGSGYVAVTPSGPPLFLLAQDGASLEASLQKVAGSVCCGCVK